MGSGWVVESVGSSVLWSCCLFVVCVGRCLVVIVGCLFIRWCIWGLRFLSVLSVVRFFGGF